jgi:hypothetical protein
MGNVNKRIRSICLGLAGPALLSLALGAGAQAADAGSVKENVKELAREVSDPSTLDRIKAHEQALEKKVKNKRERQRKDHGTARPDDAVDLAKSLDKPDQGAGAQAPAKAEAKPEPKKAAQVQPVPPAPAKAPAPAR